MFRKLLGCLIILSFVFFFGSVSSAEEEGFNLGEIVVTATKTPHLLKDVPGSVTVVTNEEIEKKHAEDLGDLLEGIAGLKVERYGSLGAASGIHLRGLYTSQVLVLMDGRPLNAPSLGSADIAGIPVANIERVEVVRGPISSLYGANALAGVVNIITKSPPEKFTNEFNLSYGTWDTIITSLQSGGTFGKFGFLLTPYHRESSSFRDNSDYKNSGIDAKFNLRIGDGNLTFSTGYEKGRLGIPGPKPANNPVLRTANQTTFGNEDVSSLFDYGTERKNYLNAAFEFGKFKFRSWLNDWDEDIHQEFMIGSPVFPWPLEHHLLDNNLKTKVYGGEFQSSWELGEKNLLTAGFSFNNDEFKVKNNDYNVATGGNVFGIWKANRITRAFYLQDEIDLRPVTLNLGVRWDNPSDFDSQVSPKVNLLWGVTDNTNLRFSYGQSFRAPSLNDLNWPASPFTQGNPDLKPEKSKSYEMGLEKSFGEKFLLRTSFFYQDIDNMIAWAPTGAGGVWQPSNVSKVKTNGIELEGKVNFTKNFSASLTSTYLDAKQYNMELRNALTNRMEEVKRQQSYAPEYKVDLGLEYKDLFKRKGLRLNFDVQYVDEIYQYYQNWNAWPAVSTDTKKLEDYTLINIKLTQSFRNGEVFLAVDNLFDKDYAHQFGFDINDQNFPMPGRSITGGMKVKF